MNTVQRIAKNTGVLVLSDAIGKICMFFFVIYTARYLGAAGFGILSFALAFTGIFGVFSDMGLQQLAIREIARNKSLASKYLGNIAVIKIVLVIITFALIVLTINLLEYPAETVRVVYLIGLTVIFNAFIIMFNSIFQAFEKMEYISTGKLLNSILLLSGALFAIHENFSVDGFAKIYFLASVIVLIYSFAVSAWKFVVPTIEFDYKFIKYTIKQALPFAITSVSLMIYVWIDRIMLSTMVGDTAVGYYSAAYNLINALSFIPSAFAISLFPVMSTYFKNSKNTLQIVYQRSVRYMYMLALPITIVTMLLSKRIIIVIYGADYLYSAQVLSVLIFTLFFIFMSMIMGHMQLAINREKTNALISLIGAILNIILNFIFIPLAGPIGAAIATVITEFIYFVGGYYVLSKENYKLDIFEITIKPLFAILVIGLFVFHFSQIPLYLLVTVAVLIYILILYITQYISDEDMKLVKQVLHNKMD